MDVRIRLTAGVFLLSLFPALAALAATGGPDGGFYTWADSDEPGVDTTRPTRSITIDLRATKGFMGDDTVIFIDLPNPFPFYGLNYSRIWVSSNGWISFADPLGQTYPSSSIPIPTGGSPNPLLAMLWNDWTLETSSPAALSGPTAAGDGYVVAFTAAPKSDPTAYITLYITLYYNGVIKVGYYDVRAPMPTAGTQAGIQNQGAGFGLPYMINGVPQNGARFRNVYAVEYFPKPKLDCLAGVTQIACGQPATAYSNAVGANNVSRYNCSTGVFNGNEAVFQFTLTRFTNITATLSNVAPRNLSLFLLKASCNELQSCLATGSPTVNRSFLGPGTYYLVVDGATPADNGPFTLDIQCANATTPISCNSTLAGQTTTGGTNLVTNWSCNGTASLTGPEKYYEVTVPAQTTLRAALGNQSPAALQVMVADSATFSLTTPTCVTWNEDVATIYGPPMGTYLIAVDAPAAQSGNFDLTVQCDHKLVCPSPAQTISLSPPAPVFGDTTGKANNTSDYFCTSSTIGAGGEVTGYTGPEDVYEFTVTTPAAISFFFDAPNPNLRLLVLRDCYEGSCTMEGGCGENFTPGTYRLVVDGIAGAAGSYTITPLVLPEAQYNQWWECPETGTRRLQDPSVISAKRFGFDSGNFCGTCCDFSLFTVVECGTEFHIPFFDDETGHLQIFDVFKQQYMDLVAKNDSATCPYTSTGTTVSWDDNTCAPTAPSACPMISSSPTGGDCRTNEVTMDVSFKGSPNICGIYRLDFLNWGGNVWDVYANCTGRTEPQWNLYRDLCSALVNYHPRPEIGIESVTVDPALCNQDIGSGTITLRNIGCAPIANFEVVITENSPGTGMPKAIPVNLNPAETITIPWTYNLTVNPSTLSFTADLNNKTLECSESSGGTVACSASGGLQRTTSQLACNKNCQTLADAGPDFSLCQGDPISLDGTASPISCLIGGTPEYRWEDRSGNALPGCDWSGQPVCAVPPASVITGTNTFTLRTRCLNNTPPCETSDTVDVEVVPNRVPPALGNVLRSYKDVINARFSWTGLLTEPVSAYKVYKSPLKDVPVATRTLAAGVPPTSSTAVDGGAIPAPPNPIAYYQIVGVSCLGDLDGPY